MKQILFALSAVAVMASCGNDNPKTAAAETKVVTPGNDTTGFAQFQAWKAQNELAAANQQAQQNLVTNTQPVKEVVRERVVYVEKPVTRKTSSSTRRSSTSSNNGSGVYNSTSQNTAKKKGWSKAAKGAAIGGASGAVLGAVINKRNRGTGAVIGGILGAGGGYVIGRSKDKKDGRY
ncbi:MAG TPA: YMGG-like glycine zipper-containing protein [Flavisolibacter sp.]|jgi:hypothetical protein|nr:YMGG-like glycine zipper-containing protein [Flavisolibacter sp.]